MPTDPKQLQKWKTITKVTAFETPWFKIRKQHMQTPGGKELDYYIHDTNDSVICVCVTNENKLIVEQQYRPPVEKVSYDYPAGRMEEDDATTEDAIKRELQEETGFTTSSIKKLGVLDTNPGFSSTRMHVFLAQGERTGASQPDETESIVINFLDPAEVLELIAAKKIACTYCISATFLAFKELGWLQTKPA